MTTEELIKPRYKVINDWPSAFSSAGNILSLTYNERQRHWEFITADHDGMYSYSEDYLKEYPHLFKPLAWWEDRKIEDMPKYIKDIGDGEVYKVREYLDNTEAIIWLNDNKKQNHTGFHQASTIHFLPATESDYLTQSPK